jgi:hypothetical protein
MTREAAMAHLDTYLDQVRRRLHALPASEVEEVLAELRSHVLDRVEGALTPRSVEQALDALGSPAEVARLNVTERALATVDDSPAPVRVLRALYRIATVSVVGVFVFLASLFGYSLALGFFLVAVMKPFQPGRVGLWRVPEPGDPNSFSIGIVEAAPGREELLGWWIIPLGLVLAAALAYLTWRFGVASVRMMGARPDRRHHHALG